MDQLPRLGKRELICLLLFTCNYVVSVWRGFLFLWVLGIGYVILLWHSMSLPLIILLHLYNTDTSKGNIVIIKGMHYTNGIQKKKSVDLFQSVSQMKFGFDWPSGFRGEDN